MKPNTVDMIEAAYQTECEAGAWLGELARTASRQLDHGMGVLAMLYRINPQGRVEVGEYFAVGGAVEVEPIVRAMVSQLPPDYVRATFASNPAITASQTGPAELRAQTRELLPQMFHPHNVHDIFIVNGLDPTGHGVYLGGLLTAEATMSRRQCTMWSRVAAHLAAGYRLRRQIAGATVDADAILTPDGRVEHATEQAKPAVARQLLREAATAIDRARTKRQRADDLEATRIWQALVAGQWTVVDRVDNDGRRLFVARKNDPSVEHHHALTERERQVVGYAALGHSNKLIGYELGLGASTVSGHLAAAAEKLGVSSRASLIQLIRATSPNDSP